jgi:hypothetical protein
MARRGTEKSILVPITMLEGWIRDLEEARRLASEGDQRRADKQVVLVLRELRLTADQTTG